MPGSFEAVAAFSLLIVPGFLLTAGYRRTRAHNLPRRDLYVLAQAVVASLAWLPAVWILWGNQIIDWAEADALDQHESAILGIVVLNLAGPMLAGLALGRVVDALGRNPDQLLARPLGWTRIFDPPTAWDAAWATALAAEWSAVEITLKSGEEFNVLVDVDSKVGLSPGPRDLFFDTEYGWDANGNAEVYEHEGIYIDGTEVRSIRILHAEYEPEDNDS